MITYMRTYANVIVIGIVTNVIIYVSNWYEIILVTMMIIVNK